MTPCLRRTSAIAAFVAVTSSSFVAGAEPKPDPRPSVLDADRGRLFVGAERMFGFTWTSSVMSSPEVGDWSHAQSSLSLLWPVASGIDAPRIGAVPRIGIDYALARGFTVGGSLGVLFGGSTPDPDTVPGGATTTYDDPTVTAWTFGARAGLVVPLTKLFGLWLRAGVTYYRFSTSSFQRVDAGHELRTHNRAAGLQVNLEPTLLIAPFEHVAFTLTMLGDVSVIGSITRETTEANRGVTSNSRLEAHWGSHGAGLVVGLVGAL